MSTAVDRPVVKIPLSQINAKAYNVRGAINPQTCVDLARRIKEEGLNNPVEVSPVDPETNDGKPYRLFAGFRRFMAHRINGAETIDARIYEGLSPVDMAVRNFTENSAREDLNFMQEARGLVYLRTLRSLTFQELAEQVGKSPKWCQLRVWATELEPEIQKAIEDGWLKPSHVEKLKSLPMGEPRYAYVRQVKSMALKGEKPRKNLAKRNVFTKKVRGRVDIFELQDHILESLAGGHFGRLPVEAQRLITVLGWVAGEATEMEVYGVIRKIAEEHNLHYEIPEVALQALQG